MERSISFMASTISPMFLPSPIELMVVLADLIVSLVSSRMPELFSSITTFSILVLVLSMDSVILRMFSMFVTIAGSLKDSITSRAVLAVSFIFSSDSWTSGEPSSLIISTASDAVSFMSLSFSAIYHNNGFRVNCRADKFLAFMFYNFQLLPIFIILSHSLEGTGMTDRREILMGSHPAKARSVGLYCIQRHRPGKPVGGPDIDDSERPSFGSG